MSNFTLLKSDCPICGGFRNGKKKHDCKRSGELIHCFSHNEPPLGWVCTGQSAIGQSLYAPAKGDDYDPEKHRAELAKLRAEHQAREAEKAKRRAELPTIGDRHQEILKFKAELTPAQNADLLRRGLFQDEIDFALANHWLFACKGGFGIAATDPVTGLFCGAQRANDDRSKKYTWGVFTGKNHLKDTGENPLAVWRSPDFDPTKPYEIKYCEGYLKSFIRAWMEWRSNPQIIVIGAAGGIFGKKSIERLLSVYPNAEKPTLLCDKDSQNLKKKNIYSAYQSLTHLIPELKFADWGQWRNETRGDCDETYGTKSFNGYSRKNPWKFLRFFKQRGDVAAAIARFEIKPNLVIDDGEKYLPDGIIPTDKKIVGLKAPKGVGKSVQQGKHCDLIRSMGLIPVQLTHRRNLSSEKAADWGLTYIDSDSPVPNHFPENGVSLVVDSCLKLKQIQNIPHERLVILLDESEQVLSHTTDSDTAIKRNRAAVMDFIGELLSRCHQVILADADLKTISIEWAKSLCGCGDRDVFIIEKKYKHNRTAIIFDDTPDLVVQLTQDLQDDKNGFAALSGQQVDSVLGSQTLETYFKSIAKSLIRVDSDTNKDPSHPAYHIVKNLVVLNEHQLTLATNTLGTGASIEGDHFDGVYGIATGSSPVESFLQQPARVRNDATRYIAVSSVANGQSQKYGGVTSVSELMLITGKHGDAIRSHLKGFGDFGDDWLFNPWVRAWAERTCLNNHLGKDFLGSVVALMEADGYRIERRSLCTKEQRKEIRAFLKGNATEKTQQYISDILSSNALLGKALEASKAANDKTYPERCAEEHGDILTLYGDDSEAIATAHITEHGFYKKLQLHFWLQQPIESVRERDKRKLHYLKKDSHGKLFPNDIRKICITPKVNAIKKYRLDEVLTRGYIYSECPILNEFMGILQDEIKRTEASLELGLGLDSCPKKSIGSMGKWLLDNLFGLKSGDRKKHQGIWVHFIESGDIPRDIIFGFWEQNMLTDEIEQPDFAPEPEPMATAITPESVPEKPTENGTDFEQLNFSIGKSVLPSKTVASRNSQATEHFFENTGLSFLPAENQPILGQNFTPPSAPIATAIAPITSEPEKENPAPMPLETYKAGDKVWFRGFYTGYQWVMGEIEKFIDDAQGRALRILGSGSHWGMIENPADVVIASIPG